VPLYEYQCVSCGQPTEIRHGFKETIDQACPACGSELKRVFFPAGIVFKGSGFYKTDSRPKNAENGSSSSSSSSNSAPAKSSSDASAKPVETKSSDSGSTPPKEGGGGSGKSEAAA
jgi:putative FmdB family regulatory protein